MRLLPDLRLLPVPVVFIDCQLKCVCTETLRVRRLELRSISSSREITDATQQGYGYQVFSTCSRSFIYFKLRQASINKCDATTNRRAIQLIPYSGYVGPRLLGIEGKRSFVFQGMLFRSPDHIKR